MKKELWIRLKQYRFENLVPVNMLDRILGAFGETDAFTRAFAAKVARKHGWDAEFSYLAIREYKKFVYLGIVSPVAVTPSLIIDKVWHEHQLFTRGYREFCQEVLGRHFDHAPELVSDSDQTDTFNAQYEQTLDLYEKEFGMAPPEPIWGVPKFDPRKMREERAPRRWKEDRTSSSSASGDDTPLYTMFNSPADHQFAPIPVDFTPGHGSFGGGGASATWAAPDSPASDVGDSVSSDAGGCSSASCGGGGCGGGGD